jgi:hypothetical protein
MTEYGCCDTSLPQLRTLREDLKEEHVTRSSTHLRGTRRRQLCSDSPFKMRDDGGRDVVNIEMVRFVYMGFP